MVSERPKSARPSTDDVYPDFGDSNVQKLDMVQVHTILLDVFQLKYKYFFIS